MCVPIFRIEKNNKWTDEDDRILLKHAKPFGRNNWKEISNNFLFKSKEDCQRRFKKINPIKRKGLWTREEDACLIELVNRFGKNWVRIGNRITNRSKKQIRERFINFLDISLKKDKFTLEEDLKILEMQQKWGNRWAHIKKFLPGRSSDMIKNRFHSCIKNKTKMFTWIKSLDHTTEDSLNDLSLLSLPN